MRHDCESFELGSPKPGFTGTYIDFPLKVAALTRVAAAMKTFRRST